jgi:predicted sulfurtransferase
MGLFTHKQDQPKDVPIMTYCTGGIRCVKINAYLEQQLGFKNVGRLQGGVISYTKELESTRPPEQISMSTELPLHLTRDVGDVSKFKGVNYVFDERMGARITADVLAQCESCGELSDVFTNCENFDCHIRFIQCPVCTKTYDGCCCEACKIKYSEQKQHEQKRLEDDKERRQQTLSRYQNANMLSRRKSNSILEFTDASSDVLKTILPTKSLLKDHAYSVDDHIAALTIYAEVAE